MQARHRATGGHEVARRVLGVDAGLHGVPVEPHVVLRERQLLTRCDPQLPLHEVEPGHQLRDGVLDLEPGVHLQEEELVGSRRRHDELDRARADVPDGTRGLDRRLAHAVARRVVEQRRRSLLDDLLVSPLEAALALPQVHDAAVPVGEHLDLDVPGVGHEPLHQQAVVTEGASRLPLRRLDGGGQLVRRVHEPHALAATARGRLEQHRVADALRRRRDRVHVGHVVRARHDRHTGRRHGLLRPDLVAHRLDRAHGWADEHEPGVLTGPGERRVLREETVARVHGLSPGRPRGGDDVRNGQIAAGRLGRSDADRHVRLGDVPGVGVGVAVHGDRPDAQAPQSRDDPHRDLTPVGHQHGVEHAPHILKTP